MSEAVEQCDLRGGSAEYVPHPKSESLPRPHSRNDRQQRDRVGAIVAHRMPPAHFFEKRPRSGAHVLYIVAMKDLDAEIVGISFLIELATLNGRDVLGHSNIQSLLCY